MNKLPLATFLTSILLGGCGADSQPRVPETDSDPMPVLDASVTTPPAKPPADPGAGGTTDAERPSSSPDTRAETTDAGAKAPAEPDAGRAPDGGTGVDSRADSDGGAPPGAPFECTEFLGPNVTGEWFAAGFETLVDNAHWQVKAPHHSFVEDWANPNHAVWAETCASGYENCETKSKCAGGKPVDRIIFVTQTGDYLGTSQATWEKQITAAIKTIKSKYPAVRHVQLMTFVRGPGNTSCGSETTVAAALDKAHQALAAASGGTISAAPRFEVPKCSYFGATPHFTVEGNKYVADMIGKYYMKNP